MRRDLTQHRHMPAAKTTRPNPIAPASRSKGALHLSAIDVVAHNPIDVLARLALAEGFDRERIGDHDLHIGLRGHWCDHHISLSHKEGEGLLQLYLVFETRIPKERAPCIRDLISKLNARLALGHFDYWDADQTVVYRQAHCLSGQARMNTAQAMTLIAAAREAAEKAYPALQYVLWAGKASDDAIEQALLDIEVQGRADDT